MAWRVAEAPTEPAVSIGDARAHLRDPDESENSLIENLVAAAERHIEVSCNHALMPQTWARDLDGFPPGDFIPLSGGPFRDIQVAYVDPDGQEQTLDSALFYQHVNGDSGVVVDGSWPATKSGPGTVTITADVGYEGGNVPASIKQAILLLVGHWFRNREAVVTGSTVETLPAAVDSLLFPYRDGATL